MANEDKTRQMNQANGDPSNGELLAAIRAMDAKLDAKVDSLDARLTSVEEIILARLNDTRPFEQQLMARLNKMEDDLSKFREETNDHFRKMRKIQELLNEDHMHIRAEHSLLEKRVEKLEDRAA
jgi:BMFP domain-containing protein YqiC